MSWLNRKSQMPRLLPFLAIRHEDFRGSAFNDSTIQRFNDLKKCHASARLMSRVNPQKSLGKSEIVTVSRVKTPGGVPILTEVAPLAQRAVTGQQTSLPRLSAVIYAYPRLSTV
jgi:hypothetical protein